MAKKAAAQPAPAFVRPAQSAPVNEDKLTRIKALVATARETEKTIMDEEERLKDMRASLTNLYQKELPDLMEECGIDRISIPAYGNYAAADAVLNPYYSANIAAGWAFERRQAAFEWLEKNGHGDLIKTAIDVGLPREKRAAAKKLVALIEKAGFAPTVKESVHSGTLTAWLKEQIELGAALPPLELIGASVGKVVKLKERKS